MITVNGDPVAGRDDATVTDLLEVLGVGADARGVAVAVDGAVVPRGEWDSRRVPAGSAVEAVVAVQGG